MGKPCPKLLKIAGTIQGLKVCFVLGASRKLFHQQNIRKVCTMQYAPDEEQWVMLSFFPHRNETI